MDSITLTLNGNKSVLEASYFPPIDLPADKRFAVGLIHLFTFNSIPNIDIDNNEFQVGNQKIIIPTGSYEIGDIEAFLKSKNINIIIESNNITLKCTITCDQDINFDSDSSVGKLLGFFRRTLKANISHESDNIVSIMKVNSIRVECNITTNSYINNSKVHTTH